MDAYTVYRTEGFCRRQLLLLLLLLLAPAHGLVASPPKAFRPQLSWWIGPESQRRKLSLSRAVGPGLSRDCDTMRHRGLSWHPAGNRFLQAGRILTRPRRNAYARSVQDETFKTTCLHPGCLALHAVPSAAQKRHDGLTVAACILNSGSNCAVGKSSLKTRPCSVVLFHELEHVAQVCPHFSVHAR